MPVVVQLHDFKGRSTMTALRELLISAARGRIRGFSFMVEMADGAQKIGFTGSHAGQEARIARSMSRRLAAVADPPEHGRWEHNSIR